MKWKSRGEWELIRSEPTPLSPTLRPCPQIYVRRACPLVQAVAPEAVLRRSVVAWKELSPGREATRAIVHHT